MSRNVLILRGQSPLEPAETACNYESGELLMLRAHTRQRQCIPTWRWMTQEVKIRTRKKFTQGRNSCRGRSMCVYILTSQMAFEGRPLKLLSALGSQNRRSWFTCPQYLTEGSQKNDIKYKYGDNIHQLQALIDDGFCWRRKKCMCVHLRSMFRYSHWTAHETTMCRWVCHKCSMCGWVCHENTMCGLVCHESSMCGWVVVEVLLYVHRNRRLIRDASPGRPPRPSHSSLSLNGWVLQEEILAEMLPRYIL